MKGFILTRHWRDTPSGIQLEIWLASDQGPIRLFIPSQKAVCFFRKADLERIQQLLIDFPSLEYKTVELKNFYGEAVMALYSPKQRQLREFSVRCQKSDITLWESDIKPHARFLMERFVTASLQVQADSSSTSHSPLISNKYNRPTSHSLYHTLTSSKVIAAEYTPQFKVLSLDIETSSDTRIEHAELYSIALYNEQCSVVFMVDDNAAATEELLESGITLYRYHSARSCLMHFLRWFQEYDPDIVIGWHVVQFDLWVLENIGQRLGVPFLLGRDRQRVHWREESDASDDNQVGGSHLRHYAQVPGRVILDGIELLRTAFYQFDSFALQAVASELLGESKLIDHDNRGETITNLFKSNKIALANYNLQDCKLVWHIFEKTKLLDFAVERSRLTGLAMDRMGGSVASFDYAYLPRLHRRGYVAPNLSEFQSDVVSPGGYVMRSKPGLYRDVLVLDFKSLYPSIIRTFSIDPYAFWLAQHQDLPDEKTISGFNGAYFSNEDAILPELITNLWTAREKAKADNNKPLSQAIKIIMNSFYGVLGSTGCRFFDPRVCSSITLRGHEIIQRSRDWIVEQGYEVIYGDTDSVFICLGKESLHQPANEIGKRLSLELNCWWRETIKQEFGVESALDVEFETHYTHFLMPTIRGSSQGSKKRYAGIVKAYKKGELSEELVFKGLETVRNDWTLLAKDFQKMLYYKVFKKEPYTDKVCQTVNELLSGTLDSRLVYRKKLRRSLSGYKKSNPPHIKAARKLVELTGEIVGKGHIIEYVLTVNGPEPLACQQSQIDYQHYIDKQLRPIADSILVFLNDSFENITKRQIDLI